MSPVVQTMCNQGRLGLSRMFERDSLNIGSILCSTRGSLNTYGTTLHFASCRLTCLAG